MHIYIYIFMYIHIYIYHIHTLTHTRSFQSSVTTKSAYTYITYTNINHCHIQSTHAHKSPPLAIARIKCHSQFTSSRPIQQGTDIVHQDPSPPIPTFHKPMSPYITPHWTTMFTTHVPARLCNGTIRVHEVTHVGMFFVFFVFFRVGAREEPLPHCRR